MIYKSYLNNDLDPQNDINGSDTPTHRNHDNIPTRLYQKYYNFFNIRNADKLAPNQAIDHAIKFQSDTKPPYMRIYNMSLAKLKTLDEYLKKVLAKEQIREF